MVFKSKVKEDLFHELRQFIFWYHYTLSKVSVPSAVNIVKLTHRTYLRYKHTENHYVSLDLVDANHSLLFKLGFSFVTINYLDYVVIDYTNKDGLGSTGTLSLEVTSGLVDFLTELINFIPSESYLKHYLNIFKNSVRNWLA